MRAIDDLLARHPAPWRVSAGCLLGYVSGASRHLYDAHGDGIGCVDADIADAAAAIPEREALLSEMAAALRETTASARALAVLGKPDCPAAQATAAGRAALARYEAHTREQETTS